MMSENTQVYPFRRERQVKVKRSAGTRIRSLPWDLVIWAVSAFFLARANLLGGLYPFIPAFVAAAVINFSRKSLFFVLPVLLGLYTAMSGTMLVAYTIITVTLTAIFLIYPVSGKKQLLIVPVMVVAVVAVVKGLTISLVSGDSYTIMISIFESIFAAGLSIVFLVVFNAVRHLNVSRRLSADEIACCFVAMIGVICGFGGLSIAQIDLQSVFSRFLILATAYLGGAGAGAAVGAMIGILPSLSIIIAPSVIATYSFSGLLAGVFNNFGRIGTALGFIFGNLILSFYLESGSEITSTLGASLIAAIIFFVLPNSLYKWVSNAFNIKAMRGAQEERNEKLLRVSGRRLRNAGIIFRDLGTALSAEPEKSLNEESAEDKTAKEQEQNIQMILSSLNRQLCNSCSLKEICWKIDYPQTFKGVLQLFGIVEKRGSVDMKEIPENFRKRCPHIKELIVLINCLYELYCRSNYWLVQKKNTSRLLASQMTGMAQILEDIAREVTDSSPDRELLERDLSSAIAQTGLPIDAAGIVALSEKYIEAWTQYAVCPGEMRCRQAIGEEISRLLGKDYTVSETSCTCVGSNGRCSFRLLSSGAQEIQIGKAQCAKNKKGICGDSGDAVLLDGGQELLMISDGMGIGQRASLQSMSALSLMSDFLEAGFDLDTTIDSVNAAVALKNNDESLVTLDICLVDLYSGDTEFIKTGGAPSFIKNGKRAKIIKGESLPIGMLSRVEKEVIEEKLNPGDLVIMASDGLLDSGNQYDAEWLRRVIEISDIDDPQEMAEYLMAKVIHMTGGRIKDDITVLVAKLIG